MKVPNKFVNEWLSHYAIWPLFASMGLACGAVGLYGYRSLTTSPDVYLDKNVRNVSYGIRSNHGEGNHYYDHTLRSTKSRPDGISIWGMGWLNNTFGNAKDFREYGSQRK